MKEKLLLILCIVLGTALAFSACIVVDSDRFVDFDSDLKGTWESNKAVNRWEEKGRLVIDYSSITISGKTLNAFTKTARLDGYSLGGYIYIKDRGSWQSGISYKIWSDANGDRWLTLYPGSGSEETLKRVSR
jgi:hypothetical protein